MTAARPAKPTVDLLAELEWRGILHATTPRLAARLATGRPISGYIGFDPSADSLHAGHLVPIFGLLRLQRAGGRPIAVVGGGTGMIGDPSGRSSERNLLDRETLERNVVAIRGQLERFLDFDSGSGSASMVHSGFIASLLANDRKDLRRDHAGDDLGDFLAVVRRQPLPQTIQRDLNRPPFLTVVRSSSDMALLLEIRDVARTSVLAPAALRRQS